MWRYRVCYKGINTERLLKKNEICFSIMNNCRVKEKILFFVLCICWGCNRVPEDYERVVANADNNREELLKVIAYYDSLGLPEKREAAYYLIGSMENKYFWAGDIVTDFDQIFGYMDSLNQNKIRITSSSPLINNKWEELIEMYGAPSQRVAEKYFDYEYYKADQLIALIDQAFLVKDSIRWAQNMSKEHFYEYILPHRIGHERPEMWGQIIYDEYREFRDTTTAVDRFEAAKAIHAYLSKRIGSSLTFNRYPFDIHYSLMSAGRKAACRHLVYYMTMVMRANGLPVAVDYVRLWGTRDGGHYWGVLQLEDGSSFPFDTGYTKPFGEHERPHYGIAKVYRQTFKSKDTLSRMLYLDLPHELLDNDHIDVTHEYTKTHSIEVKIRSSLNKGKKRAVICTFDNKTWRPQSWGHIKGEKAFFDNMGTDVLYIVMVYEKGQLYPASDPFILERSGKRRIIRAAGNQDMRLLRKFPRYPRIKEFESLLVGARIQGANRQDFSDATDIFTITEIPDKIEEIPVNIDEQFRYIRILTVGRKKLGIAELSVYDDTDSVKALQGRIIGYPEIPEEYGTPYQHAFDENLDTYFMTYLKSEKSWAGLDFGERKTITKIRYAPRSDTNFILVGDTYELCVWSGDDWRSLGKRVASQQCLLYENVPARGLYVLRNHTRGREERIFTYENGRQIWW